MNSYGKRPTIKDVAEIAGVSRGTVSRVVSGAKWVSAESRAAVEAAIETSGYRVNAHARSLVTRRSNSVAFLLTEPLDALFGDPNFSTLLKSASVAVGARGYSLVLMIAGTRKEQLEASEYLVSGHVDGVLLFSTHTAGGLVTTITKAGIPAVSNGIPAGATRRLGYVSSDDEGGAREMIGRLRATGRRRIAHIAGPQDAKGGIDRLAAFRDEFGDGLDPDLVAIGDYTRLSGSECMSQLLIANPDIDAVFAANDAMARGAIDAIVASGRTVPADVAVGGFDDSRFATDESPLLTTVKVPFDRISEEMVRLLIDSIEGKTPGSVLLPTELVVRESA